MHTPARSVLIGGAVMVAIATSIALGRGPVHTFREKPFDAALHEDMATLAMTSDRLAQLIGPRVVQTESILPIERDPLMMALSEPAARTDVRQTVGATASARRPSVAGDICAQHKLRKVYDGPRWRCRK
jgi:hypothetical protein